MMQHKTYKWQNSYNTELFAQSWSPEQTPKAVICLIHGIGEHSSRYDILAKFYNSQGFAVLTFDKQGHGQSKGKQGVIHSYKSLLADVDFLLTKAEELFPKSPRILYGHSMGGGEVLNHVLRNNNNYLGVISTGPWLKSQRSPAPILIPFIRLAYKLMPNFRLKITFDANKLSHDDFIKERYKKDELIHDYVSVRLFLDSYDAGFWALKNASKLKTPVFILHGQDDDVTSHIASQEFAQKAKAFCKLKIWKDGFHELHNESFRNELFEEQIQWINQLIVKNDKLQNRDTARDFEKQN